MFLPYDLLMILLHAHYYSCIKLFKLLEHTIHTFMCLWVFLQSTSMFFHLRNVFSLDPSLVPTALELITPFSVLHRLTLTFSQGLATLQKANLLHSQHSDKLFLREMAIPKWALSGIYA